MYLLYNLNGRIIILVCGLVTSSVITVTALINNYSFCMKQIVFTGITVFICLSSYAQAGIDSVKATPGAVTLVTDSIKYATLYVYREKHRGGAHLSYDLYEDDSVICRVRNDSKYTIKLYKEGKILFWAKTERKATKEIDIQFGKEYYLKCDVSKFGVFVMSPVLQLMYEEYGKFEFKGVEGKNNSLKD